ncbi:ester cyclase [Micromonospora sp. NPDC050417]|uniref:ester cyclase n=1 Tax=Micromonospora sp. NPDC050417 TaxID=3364280 RepID=UPI0037B4F1EE
MGGSVLRLTLRLHCKRFRVAIRMTRRGTHRGEFQGIPATGRVVAYQSHEFYRIAGGLVAEEWIRSDMATLYQQIG